MNKIHLNNTTYVNSVFNFQGIYKHLQIKLKNHKKNDIKQLTN